jgi:hypothetical protein
VSKLPEWNDNEAMLRWLNEKLDEILHEMTEESYEAFALWSAEQGEVKYLKELYPQIADFIAPRRRKKGQTKPKPMPSKPKLFARLAAEDVQRIRALWRANYGKWKRYAVQGEESAEWFAAQRWSDDEVKLDYDTVAAAAKPSGPKRPKQQRK